MSKELSPREKEVLLLLANGLLNPAIAEKLFISVHTAKAHVCSILYKLGADNRTQAIAIAFRKGLIN